MVSSMNTINEKYEELVNKIKGGTIFGELSDQDIEHTIVAIYYLAKQEALENHWKSRNLR